MDWDQLAAGEGCPFDLPREEPNDYWETAANLEVSTLCLLKNQTYRGHCLLIYDVRHAIRLDQLTLPEWQAFASDLHLAVGALVNTTRADHINVESLGNLMPHLHWHLIPRYKDDPRWSGPIWTTTMDEMRQVQLPGKERRHLMTNLRKELAQGL